MLIFITTMSLKNFLKFQESVSLGKEKKLRDIKGQSAFHFS